jgi:Protein of unknown function (DUF1493)
MKVMDEEIEVLVRLLEKYVGKIPVFHEDLRIDEDLKLAGDDVSDLLIEYSQVFGVDISAFPYDDYFAPEGFCPLSLIKYLLGFEEHKYKSLYVRDLIRGIRQKRLTG